MSEGTGGPGPLFTVVIPTRHRDDLLARCLGRLAPGAQTLAADRYEVVVTDDGSASTSEGLVRERFPWARWIAGPRRGPGANRNNGAREARAEWLAFTDDDCVPGSDWLAGFAAALTPGVRVYEGCTTCKEGTRSPLMHSPQNTGGGWLWSCNMAVRRDLYREMGGFDEEFPHAHMEDVDFRERFLGRSEEIRFVPAASVDHPPRPANLGRRFAPMQESEFLFYFKSGHSGPYLPQHLRRMAGNRFYLLKSHGFLRADSVRAGLALIPEALYVLRHGPAWEKKYRERYAQRERIPYRTEGMFLRTGFR